jgi:20S proteasome subunit alpha 6
VYCACTLTPQAAKTYLEKHFESFPTASLEELVQHGLKALAATLGEGELTKQNVSLAIVGDGAPFVMLDDEDVEPYVAVSR